MEQTDKYVFHGSGSEIEIFEPQQAYTRVDGVDIPDGDPAIFASSKLNYAIFMAIINMKNCPKGYRSSSDGREFKATAETLKQLTPGANGFVYVFNKSDFKERANGEEESMRHESIKPLFSYKVTFSDIDFPIHQL
ncbi:MAG: hypothetical protein JWN37_719 [Candidatus Nomurabacteria bacterium]|nr:hypothetical protein [Candidatus Nomurabacteria bacterium]